MGVTMPEVANLIFVGFLAVTMSVGMFHPMRLFRHWGSRTDPPKSHTDTPTPRRRQRKRAVTDDLKGLLAELDQLTRKMQGSLDTSVARLENIIRDADARIDELTRLVRAAQDSETQSR
jgi:hypothetical protein